MGHSYVDYAARSILMQDAAIENIVKLMKYQSVQMFVDTEYPGFVADQFHAWERAIEESGVGCIDLQLDEVLRDDRTLQVNLELLDAAEAALAAFGPVVPRSYLAKIIGITFRRDVETATILNDLRRFRSLLSSS